MKQNAETEYLKKTSNNDELVPEEKNLESSHRHVILHNMAYYKIDFSITFQLK
jgi:hypothetical protein